MGEKRDVLERLYLGGPVRKIDEVRAGSAEAVFVVCNKQAVEELAAEIRRLRAIVERLEEWRHNVLHGPNEPYAPNDVLYGIDSVLPAKDQTDG